jgi:hypothetical protein
MAGMLGAAQNMACLVSYAGVLNANRLVPVLHCVGFASDCEQPRAGCRHLLLGIGVHAGELNVNQLMGMGYGTPRHSSAIALP